MKGVELLQNIIYIVTILSLIKTAYIDYKQKIIPDRLNLIIVLLGIFNLILNFKNCKIYIASAAITFVVFLFIAIITDGGIGGGDIKLFTALSLIFGQEMLLIVAVTFSLAAIISIVKVMLKRINIKDSVALAPSICIGVFACLIKIYIS
jgi:prepilin signal peptidase PulO-like enzyme (type II secretory pathway)